jgi:dihydroflavonol-4-reductase
MTTLVTGGTGLVGLNVVRMLAARGEDVRLLVRPSAKPRLGLDDLAVAQAPGDISDEASVRAAMRGVKRVYHIAALTYQGPWQSVRTQLERVNVGGTAIVARAALAAGVERLVYTSSTVAVASGLPESPATEESAWDLGGLAPYYDTKRAAELVMLDYVKQGLPAVIVNPGYMLGAWDVKPTSGTMLIEAARSPLGIPLYPTRGGNSFTDVEDVARGHLLAMEKGRVGERYVLAGHNLRYRAFFTLVNRMLGKPPARLAFPRGVSAVLGPLFDGIGHFIPERMDNYNSSVMRSGHVGLCASSGKAVRELGYAISPLEGAIEKALAWFRAQRYLPPARP